MEEIKVGDVVSLKSDDNAIFTVGYLSTDRKVVGLYWFDHSDRTLNSKDVPIAIITN